MKDWLRNYSQNYPARTGFILLMAVIFCVFLFAEIAHAKQWPSPPRISEQYKSRTLRAARHVWGINAPSAALASQIHQESAWNEKAKSHVGAAGLTQFMSATATDIAEKYPELWPPNPFSPTWAINAQARYMKFLYDRVEVYYDNCHRFAMAAQAYNGGETRIRKRQRLSTDPGRCFGPHPDYEIRGYTCGINPGISAGNQRENENYARRILTTIEPRYLIAGWGKGACWELR